MFPDEASAVAGFEDISGPSDMKRFPSYGGHKTREVPMRSQCLYTWWGKGARHVDRKTLANIIIVVMNGEVKPATWLDERGLI